MKKWTWMPQEKCYTLQNISYCANPSNPELQAMHLYIPEEYMTADGLPDPAAQVQTRSGATYTAASVPIVLYNDIGGYSECRPAELTARNRRFLQDGYLVASVGARGRQSRNAGGQVTGKAPAGLVDLKAAVRWLRSNAQSLPGDTRRIISVGTSAGGATSALLGLTGNSPDFLPELKAIGAAMDQRDDVFAAQCYCPIADLAHADLAYEWMFRAKTINTFSPTQAPRVMTAEQRQLSAALAGAYPEYINSLGLSRTLGPDGRSGSFYTGLMDQIGLSLTRFLEQNAEDPARRQALLAELNAGGEVFSWQEGRAVVTDLDQYVRLYIGRMKGCPAFDQENCRSFENELFGGEEQPFRHFSAGVARALEKCGQTEAARAYDEQVRQTAGQVARMDQMGWMQQGRARDMAKHFRIRVGSRDSDTSFAVGYSLYLALEAAGLDADYALVWGLGHTDADEPGAFGAWVDSLTGQKDKMDR